MAIVEVENILNNIKILLASIDCCDDSVKNSACIGVIMFINSYLVAEYIDGLAELATITQLVLGKIEAALDCLV